MSIGLAFWIICLVAIVFGVAWWRLPNEPRWPGAFGFVLFVLVLLLGYAVFGTPIHR